MTYLLEWTWQEWKEAKEARYQPCNLMREDLLA